MPTRPIALSFRAQSFADDLRDNMQARPVTVSFFPTSTQLSKPDRSGHGEVFDGILTFWITDTAKAYGYIHCPQLESDIFVHKKDLLETVEVLDKVTFTLNVDETGKTQATKVKRANVAEASPEFIQTNEQRRGGKKRRMLYQRLLP